MTDIVTIETDIPFSGTRDGFDYAARFVTFKGFPPDIAAHPPHALVFGIVKKDVPPLVRVHSGCRTGDTFGSSACDCGGQLTDTIQIMSKLAGQGRSGILLYISHHEGRGIGLNDKIRAYKLMKDNPQIDTYDANIRLNHPADARDYTCAAQMLRALEIDRLRLLTGNPAKVKGLEIPAVEYGLEILEHIAMPRHETPENARYLEDKKRIGGHRFS